MNHTVIAAIVAVAVLLPGCATNRGSTVEEKRQAVLEMRAGVLEDLYQRKQSARAEISAAPGYAVFSNANVNVIFPIDNMPRVIQLVTYARTLEEFVQSGWSFGGQADAAAKAGDKGGAVGGEAVLNRVSVYQLTESGLALQATVKGTRFWQDSDLN